MLLISERLSILISAPTLSYPVPLWSYQQVVIPKLFPPDISAVSESPISINFDLSVSCSSFRHRSKIPVGAFVCLFSPKQKVREAVYHSGKCQSVLLLLKGTVACGTEYVFFDRYLTVSTAPFTGSWLSYIPFTNSFSNSRPSKVIPITEKPYSTVFRVFDPL